MEPNAWMGPPPPAGWYPDPDDDRKIRHWDGTTWTQQPPSTSGLPGTVDDSQPVAQKASPLTIILAVFLILLGLLFGFVAAILLSDGVPEWAGDPSATKFADTVWRLHFAAMLTLCVIAFILGVQSLAKSATHPRYSVIAGVFIIVVGLVGCVLGLFFTHTIDTVIGYLGVGFLFTLGGVLITLLSAIALAVRRRSSRMRVAAVPQPGTAKRRSFISRGRNR